MENKPLTSIRGFAALWVVIHHLGSSVGISALAFQLGYAAVDLFFILSGMILASVYSHLSFGDAGLFWLKRVCRVYPAHWVSLIGLCFIFSYPAWTLAALQNLFLNWGFAASALLLQPFFSLQSPANPVAWSVGIELFCYFLFPVAIIFVRRLAPLRSAAIALAVLLVIEWVVLRTYIGDTHGVGAVCRGLAGFGVGMLLWRVGSGLQLTARGATLFEVMGLLGMAGGIAMNRPELIPLWSASLLFGLSFDRGLLARALHVKWCFWLGNISFSMYLLHYPLALATDKWLPVTLFPGNPVLIAWLRFSLLLAVILIMSALSYRFIETPGRRIPALLRDKLQRKQKKKPVKDITTSGLVESLALKPMPDTDRKP